jgi:hypothetical protein
MKFLQKKKKEHYKVVLIVNTIEFYILKNSETELRAHSFGRFQSLRRKLEGFKIP